MCGSVTGRSSTLGRAFVVDGSKILSESLEAMGAMR